MVQTLPTGAKWICFKAQRDIHIMSFNCVLQGFLFNHSTQNLFPCLAHLVVNHSCIMICVLAWYHAFEQSKCCQTTVKLEKEHFLFLYASYCSSSTCSPMESFSLRPRVAAANGRHISVVSSQDRSEKGRRKAFPVGSL